MRATAVLLAAVLSLPATGWAADLFVDDTTSGCSQPVDTDFNPDTESCGSGSELVYSSVDAAVAAHAGGDNIYVLAGSYAVALNNTLASGPSPDQLTTLQAWQGQSVTFLTPVGATNGNGIAITSRANIYIFKIIVDNANVVAPNGKRGFNFRITGTIATPAANIVLDGVRATNGGIGMFTAHINNLHVTHSRFDHNGHDEFDHGIYTDNGTNDAIIEYSEFDNNAQMGAQLYKFPSRMQFRYNYVHDNCQLTNSGSTIYLSGVDNVLEGNVVISDGSCTTGITLSTGSSTAPTRNTLRQNSLYCTTGTCPNYGINVASATVTNTTLQNNIALGFGTNLRNLGTGTTLTDNLTSGTAADIWTNPAAGDLTLKAGSVAINGGTDIGRSFCGTNPDQGAFEVCGFSAASIVGHTMDVTMENIYPPLQVFGPNGWSVICTPNPDACGAPTVVSASLLGSAVARLTLAGVANIDCTTDQTWTVSFNAAAGSMSDYILIGGIYNQFAHSFTGRAVTNNCTGSGGPELPAGAYIYYTMDGNANDSSGGNRHATTSGVTFATAKYSQGMQVNPGENDYAELPYLSGVNPSTQSLTIAYGVYIPPTDLGIFRYVGGVPLGTDQRMYVMRNASNNWRMGIQANSASSATEFSATSGWTHVCQTMNAATDTATLWINGQQGVVSGASVQTYTSYAFSANYRIGLPSGRSTANAGNHLYDEFRLYQSVVSCADLYAAWEPPTSGWTGTVSLSSARIYSAKTDWLSSFLPLAGLNDNASASPGGIFTYAGQLDCTVADCSAISYKLYYSCALCPSAGAELPVPDTAASDQIEMFGSSPEGGMLTGAHGANLNGALSHVNGTTLMTASATNGPDLAQNNSTVHRGTVRFTAAATVGREYCFKWREQSGLVLDSYTPSGGVCVTVGAPGAAAGF